MIAVLSGGVGAARLLAGLVQVTGPDQLTAIVNVGDDLVLHGLHISPDLDTVTYTLAGAMNQATGWGLADETWQAMESLTRYGGATWFSLGDRDLGTHLFRTQCLADGDTLTGVTAKIASAWNVPVRLLPVTNDPVRTMMRIIDDDTLHEGLEVGFQDYFVRRRHAVRTIGVRFAGCENARPAPGVLDAIAQARQIVIAPSNPIVSIAPVLAVPGVSAAVASRRDRVVAVSPIIAGAALKGPADRLLTEMGHESSVVGVARLYREFASTLVIDVADEALASAVETEGMRCVVAPSIMSTPDAAAALGRTVLDAGRP